MGEIVNIMLERQTSKNGNPWDSSIVGSRSYKQMWTQDADAMTALRLREAHLLTKWREEAVDFLPEIDVWIIHLVLR
jgi:hypothetical protein